MKLTKIEIQNFRAINNIKFDALDYTLLVGANNVGKTTIIDALRLFYEHDGYKYIEDRDKPRNSNHKRESWIELCFRISGKENMLLPRTYSHYKKQIKLKKWLANAPAGFLNNQIYKYNEKGDLQKSNFFNMEGIKNGRLGKIIYIPAISSIEQYTKLSGPSYLRDILEILLNYITSKSHVYINLQESFNDFSKEVVEYESSSGIALQKFTSQISSELEPWGVGFNLEFVPPDLKFIVKNLIDWHLLDNSTNIKTHGVEMFGSGFQRHFIASLIKTIAGFTTPIARVATKDFNPKFTLFLFEEPEAYLHPPQQIKLAKNLSDLAKKRSMQIIASTHSSNFVSRNTDKITNLLRVRRDGSNTKVFQIDNKKKNKIFAAREELEKIIGENNKLT
ncbi:AAA family ATPase [Legionella pneumophila serogroup 8]